MLISPGVEVTIIDESQYLAAPTNSIPLIVIATAQNKATPAGDAVAAGTTALNANKLYLMTGQRDLANTYGSPFFYRTSSGTPLHGYELNEYGLMAAYSVLGVSNRAYVMRADVDLAALSSRVSRPRGVANNGAYWLDTSETRWGIFEWNAQTAQFDNKIPLVITSTTMLDVSGLPLDSVGEIGSYSVVTTSTRNPIYFKNSENSWVLVGSDEWMNSWAAVRGANSNPFITIGQSISINGVTVVSTDTTVATLVSAINGAGITGVTAQVSSGRVAIYVDSTASSDGSTEDGGVEIQNVSGTMLAEIGINEGVYYGVALQQSVHTQNPRWRASDTTPRPSGSVWNKLSEVNFGLDFVINKYDALTNLWNPISVRVAKDDASANRALNPAAGGLTIPVGTVYAQYDVFSNTSATFRLFERIRSGQTIIQGQWTNPIFTDGDQFSISASNRADSTMSTPITVSINGTTPAAFVSAFLSAGVPNTSARVTDIGSIEIIHQNGGVIELKDVLGQPLVTAGFISTVSGVRDSDDNVGAIILSNWQQLTYSAVASAPGQNPLDGTLWYYGTVSDVDVMIHDGTTWKGYRTVSNDVRGYNLTQTNDSGVMIAASAPFTQTDGDALTYGDLWLDTADLENYPALYRWEDRDGVDQWVLLNNTDQTTENGVLFADARWDSNGTADPINDPLPSIAGLTVSDYLDLDAPDPLLFPAGTLLFNTRRSGYNVKRYVKNYFNAVDYPDAVVLPDVSDSWVSASRLRSDGSPYMGRNAVRDIVVSAIKAAIDTNTEIREEQRQYNLMACPGYPEALPNLVALNNERNNTAFIVGDTPLRLKDNGNDLVAWATDGGPSDLQVADPYAGVFYPACLTNDLSGNEIVQPASHMMLRTIVRSDEQSYPWFAPAGERRGIIDNATSIGYIDADTGEYVQIANRESIRDVLYTNKINPITFMPGSGLMNYGNKTLQGFASAMDRINVARLICYIRNRLETIGRSYLFEPNDQITRNEVKNEIEKLMNELVANRGLYDYLVVCDESNNTPTRIDRNELWVDIAIEPVKSIEFVYIPVRIRNTGSIGNNTSTAG